MSDSDFYSFDKALDKLSLDEDDLKRLISAGEIRAFRDGSKMRLRAEDVERVSSDLGSVGESDAGEVLEVEDVGFGDDDDGMVTTQLSEEDTLLDDDFDLEEVEMEDEAPSAKPAAGSARSGARGSARSSGRAAAAQPEAEPESTGLLFASIVTTAVMVFGLAFVFAAFSARSNGITDGVVNMFAESE